jgi:hypothetical protein
MHKIPVGETISGAYGFAFAGFLTVLGTVWFPFLVLGAIDAGLAKLLAPDLFDQIRHGNIDTDLLMFDVRRIQWMSWIFSLIIQSVIAVGLQERALGRVQGPTFIYFSLGGSVWRMVGAMFLLTVSIIVIVALSVAAAVAVSVAAINFIPHYGPLVAAVMSIVTSCWVIYACVRLSFFLPAVVVAEGHIGLGRSWELGGGNFWRIFVIYLAIFVPVAIGFYILWAFLVGPLLPWDLLSHIHPKMTATEIQQLDMDVVKRVFQQLRGAWPVVLALFVIQQLVFIGLNNGAVGKAYLAVADKG